MIIVGSGLAAPRPPSAHLVPLDRPAAAGRVVKFGQRLERGLLADPPASGLDELENSHGPALIPAAQCEAERGGGLSFAVPGVNDQQRPLPPLPSSQPILRNQIRNTGRHYAARP